MSLGFKTALTTGVIVALAFASSAYCEEFKPLQKGSFVVNTRLTSVTPDAGNTIYTSAHVDSGLKANVGNSTVPTLGLVYFLTDNVAVDLTLGTSHHNIKAVGGATNVSVHETWVVPPVLAVQYHFNPKGKFNPYIGAGLNAMIFYSGKDKNGFKVRLKNGAGYALQAGADVALGGPWTLNLDVKKVYFKTKATINNGGLVSDVHLDPTVASIGIGYRF